MKGSAIAEGTELILQNELKSCGRKHCKQDLFLSSFKLKSLRILHVSDLSNMVKSCPKKNKCNISNPPHMAHIYIIYHASQFVKLFHQPNNILKV